MKRFVAVQIGARRAYAVPSILAGAEMLEAFYTDLCSNAGWGSTLARVTPGFLRRGAVKRLLERRLPANLLGKTYTFPGPTLRYLARSRLAGNGPLHEDRVWNQFEKELAGEMIRLGTGQATHLFSMFGECTPFIAFARQRGLAVVTEFFEMPSTLRILKPERETYPELEPHPGDELVEAGHAQLQARCRLTDWALAPSEQVRRDLAENLGLSEERCFVVPYAVHPSWLQLQNRPVRGRILFVGTAGLRKGIHYLGMASRILSHEGYEFRVAGNVSSAVRNHKLTQNLHFLGLIPRSEIKAEYEQGDVFVLPSLAEGSAEVTYEALAAGLPVITTKAAGSVVRDGVEGFIVPERDPQALADRIAEVVTNRALRERMAAAAKVRAGDYTWDRYAARLLAALAHA